MPAYNINKSNGTPVTIPEGAIDTQFDIPLVGQNATNYGDDVAQAFLRLLENFANASAPTFGSGRTIGQLWYDTANTQLKVWNGAAWDPLVVDSGGLTVTGDILPDADNVNDLGSPGARYAAIYVNNAHVSGTLFTTAISAGSNATAGTIEGDWTLTAGSTLQATYADLAERYEADAIYPAGTVVKIGGEKEITATTSAEDTDVFGVISTAPAFGLNAAAGDSDSHPYVAIAGRVPVRVIGSVRKGQRLVTSDVAGFAIAVSNVTSVSPYAVVGRALENKTTETEGTVLAVVGAR
jgi:hypothetical protein